MKILVLGAGATGGYFGGRLFESGADVTFLVREKRFEILKKNGLRIVSPKGDVTLSPKLVTADSLHDSYDLVILSCKAYDLQSSMDSIRSAIKEKTVILPFLNGIGHLDILDKEFGQEHVLGGVVYIPATLGSDGEVRHLGALSKMTFGARKESQKTIVEQFAKIASQAKFDSELSQNVMQDMWEKFVFLTTLAGMTCLMRSPVGNIVATDEGEQISLEFLKECESVSAGFGYPVTEKAHKNAVESITQKGSPATSSMFRDLQNGFRVELDSIVGDMLKRGRAKNLTLPLLRVAYAHLQAYDYGLKQSQK